MDIKLLQRNQLNGIVYELLKKFKQFSSSLFVAVKLITFIIIHFPHSKCDFFSLINI